jgi:hypothetical protein
VTVIVVCILLVLAGLVMTVRWGGLAVEQPQVPEQDGDRAGADDAAPAGLVLRRYLWFVNLAVAAGFGAGLLAAGAGGRLAMRLLAVTAGDAAQGRITEADQVVGRISVGGTIEFILFTGLFFGPVTGALYLLLLVAGTRLEPLRRANPDFDLVGPGWVSVVTFVVLVVFHGMLVAALAGRISRAVPLLGTRPAAIAAHAPLLLLLPLVLVAVGVAVVGLLVVLASRARPVVAAWGAPGLVRAGRIALVLVALVALPGFLADVVDILGRP